MSRINLKQSFPCRIVVWGHNDSAISDILIPYSSLHIFKIGGREDYFASAYLEEDVMGLFIEEGNFLEVVGNGICFNIDDVMEDMLIVVEFIKLTTNGEVFLKFG